MVRRGDSRAQCQAPHPMLGATPVAPLTSALGLPLPQ